jgi:hypothetical protein
MWSQINVIPLKIRGKNEPEFEGLLYRDFTLIISIDDLPNRLIFSPFN